MSQSLLQSSLQTEASLGCHPALDCREINSGLMKIEAVCLSVLDRRPEPQAPLPRNIEHLVGACEKWHVRRRCKEPDPSRILRRNRE
jgi:hypothetical protein